MKNPLLKKAILFTFCLLTSAFFLHAQAPQGIPYQAIARNASGAAIANTAVKVRFSIRDSIATGAIRYQETHSPTTSALGLFSVNVGMGTVVSGTFSGINWGKNAKFLQVELNTTGGTTYTDLGTSQMMSVPYAMYASVAGNTTQPNSNYMPSADSVLTLVGVTKLPEGNYMVPNNETWKIVSISIPAPIATVPIKVFRTACAQFSNYADCQYNQTDLFSVKIGSNKYSEGVNLNAIFEIAPTCSQCPDFVLTQFNGGYNGANYKSLQMPLWANSGEQVSVGPYFVVYVEKYR